MSRQARNFRSLLKTTRGIVGATLLAIGGLASVALAATTVTTTTTETTVGSHTFAAQELVAGTVIEFECQGIATATNSTDTLTIRVKLGSTTILTIGPTDVANNNIWYARGRLVIRTAGAAGTLVGAGVNQALAAAGSALVTWILASTAVDTTGALALTVTAQWSTNNAGNSCRNDVFAVHAVG